MKKILIIVLVVIAVVIVGSIMYGRKTASNIDSDKLTYSSQVYNLSFKYPNKYFVVERDETDGLNGYHSINLFEDTQANRDLISGKITGAEGPVSISVKIFQNDQQQTLTDWLKTNPSSNLTLALQEASSSTLGFLPALAFTWDGLYRGDSIVAIRGVNVVVASVTYFAVSDIIRADFEKLVSSLKLGDATSSVVVPNDNQNNKIKISSPKAATKITSPLTVTGTAVGNWYFEASFPVKLYDGNGKLIVAVPATAEGDWMTTAFVPFKGTLVFTKPITPTGTLVFEKDNPSGEPSMAESVSIPISF